MRDIFIKILLDVDIRLTVVVLLFNKNSFNRYNFDFSVNMSFPLHILKFKIFCIALKDLLIIHYNNIPNEQWHH